MRFYLAVNEHKDPDHAYSEQLIRYITEHGAEAEIFKNCTDEFGNYHFILPENPGARDVILVLGGDGTFLQCVNDLNLCSLRLPLMGVNLGTLGFLAQVEWENVYRSVDEILAGEFSINPYSLLSASLKNDRVDFCEQAFNDVVIGRYGFARVITVDVSIDGKFAYQARCDGVIVSSSYGSTAYNVSLGGPVVPPGTPVFVITPIAPHMPGLRPIIVPDTACVEIRIYGGKNDEDKAGLVTCDGRSNGIWLEKDDVITITRYHRGGEVLRLNNDERDFYDIFREKLLTVK